MISERATRLLTEAVIETVVRHVRAHPDDLPAAVIEKVLKDVASGASLCVAFARATGEAAE